MFKFYFQDSCENIAVTTFTPSDNGGKQAFTITGYTISDYFDVGDDMAFTYNGNYYVYSIIDITGDVITMSFDYNAAITNSNTSLQFSIKVECSPYDFLKGKFEWNKDRTNYFYRKKYTGKVLFKGDDYQYLYNALFENCCQVTFKVFKLCDGVYSLYYRARINKTEGKWNESKCTFETELLPLDKYDCILAAGDELVNIYQAEKYDVLYWDDDEGAGTSFSSPFFEFLIRPVAPVSAGTTYDNGDGGNLFIEINSPSGEAVDPVTGNAWTVFVRNKRVYVYEGDSSFTAPDPLNGYDLLSQVYEDGKWICTYTRQENVINAPYINSYTNGAGCDFLTPQFGARLYDPINDNCIDLFYLPASLITSPTVYNSVQMNDCMELLIAKCNNLSGITSDFFEINPIGDTIGYVAGINYYTGLNNVINAIKLSAMSDVIDPNAAQKAELVEISFNEMMKQLNYMFNVFWFIDEQNRVRIEHDYWFNSTLGTTTYNVSAYDYNKYKKEYSFIKEQIPQKERFTFKYSLLPDNRGTEIVYPQNCTNSPVILERNCIFITDIWNLRNGNISSDSSSIVMFISNNCYYEQGVITGIWLQNNHLSWANLHEHYHRSGRILSTGRMNFLDDTFINVKKLRNQAGQKYLGCCLDISETRIKIISELGTGDANKITYDINSNTFEFELSI